MMLLEGIPTVLEGAWVATSFWRFVLSRSFRRVQTERWAEAVGHERMVLLVYATVAVMVGAVLPVGFAILVLGSWVV